MSADEVEVVVGEVLAAFFVAVSFVAGGRPDYESIGGLFVEDGRLIDTATATVSTVEQFIVPRRAAVDAGSLTEFREVETGAETQSFGNVAHRFSSYTKAGSATATPLWAEA